MVKKNKQKNTQKGGKALRAMLFAAQQNGGDWNAALQSLSKKQQKNLLGGFARTANAQNQFLLGLLLGAGAAWVLSDEELRGKILRTLMKAYGSLMGSVEEIKEQMADIQAEMTQEL